MSHGFFVLSEKLQVFVYIFAFFDFPSVARQIDKIYETAHFFLINQL